MDELSKPHNVALHVELQQLLNRVSRENRSDTPDYILANFMIGCLASYEQATNARECWYGRKTVADIPVFVHGSEPLHIDRGVRDLRSEAGCISAETECVKIDSEAMNAGAEPVTRLTHDGSSKPIFTQPGLIPAEERSGPTPALQRELRDLAVARYCAEQPSTHQSPCRKYMVIDIDGTLANNDHRQFLVSRDAHINWDEFFNRCVDDTPYEDIVNLVVRLSAFYEPVFVTGRDEAWREQTQAWLDRYVKIDAPLLMRPEGSHMSDMDVKPKLVTDYGLTFDDIAFALDDRDKMVAAWRQLGVRCLQVQPGPF
jgi:hypothetical protein